MSKVIWRKSAYLEKWRISQLRYRLYDIDSSIRTRVFVYYFAKKFSGLKILLVFLVFIFVCEIGENFRRKVDVEKIKAIFFPKSSSSPNKHIVVRAKRVCL